MFRVAERWCASRAWRVAASDSEVGGNWELVELREDVAETIMEKEDLVLSTVEQVSDPNQRSFL